MERSLHSYRNSSLKRVFLALDFDMLSKDYIIGLVSYGQKEQQKKTNQNPRFKDPPLLPPDRLIFKLMMLLT